MGRMNPAPVPVEFAGATDQAMRETRKRVSEQRCAQLVDGAWSWIDRHPAIAAAGAELFAAQAITLRRVPADVRLAGATEQWILAAWAARQQVAA